MGTVEIWNTMTFTTFMSSLNTAEYTMSSALCIALEDLVYLTDFYCWFTQLTMAYIADMIKICSKNRLISGTPETFR